MHLIAGNDGLNVSSSFSSLILFKDFIVIQKFKHMKILNCHRSSCVKIFHTINSDISLEIHILLLTDWHTIPRLYGWIIKSIFVFWMSTRRMLGKYKNSYFCMNISKILARINSSDYRPDNFNYDVGTKHFQIFALPDSWRRDFWRRKGGQAE